MSDNGYPYPSLSVYPRIRESTHHEEVGFAADGAGDAPAVALDEGRRLVPAAADADTRIWIFEYTDMTTPRLTNRERCALMHACVAWALLARLNRHHKTTEKTNAEVREADIRPRSADSPVHGVQDPGKNERQPLQAGLRPPRHLFARPRVWRRPVMVPPSAAAEAALHRGRRRSGVHH